MDNEHIKNSVVDVSVRSGNCVRCKQNYEYNQNDICDGNTSEMQNFKIVIDEEDKCKNMRQRNIARNLALIIQLRDITSRSELSIRITS
jgi:hypothetical protein